MSIVDTKCASRKWHCENEQSQVFSSGELKSAVPNPEAPLGGGIATDTLLPSVPSQDTGQQPGLSLQHQAKPPRSPSIRTNRAGDQCGGDRAVGGGPPNPTL